jgi:hypothetical protein
MHGTLQVIFRICRPLILCQHRDGIAPSTSAERAVNGRRIRSMGYSQDSIVILRHYSLLSKAHSNPNCFLLDVQYCEHRNYDNRIGTRTFIQGAPFSRRA